MTMDAVHAALSRQKAAAEAAALTSAVRTLSRAPRVAEPPSGAGAPYATARQADRWPVPKTGAIGSPKGRMVARALARASFVIREEDRALYATQELADGTAMVSLDGSPNARVTLRTEDYQRIRMDHRITGTRWFLEDGEVRAYRRKGRGLPCYDESYSVAALILGAQDGDVIHMEDCLDLRPERMRLERRGGH